MAQNQIQRPALGQWFDLGALYDARTDTFTSTSLLTGSVPVTAIASTSDRRQELRFFEDDSYKSKLQDLRIGSDLGLSLLSGLTDVSGAAAYLKEVRSSNSINQSSIEFSLTTMREKLVISDPELRVYLDLDAINVSGATHVLVEVVWGADTIAMFKQHVSPQGDQEQLRHLVSAEYSRLEYVIAHGAAAGLEFHEVHAKSNVTVDITLFSDLMSEIGHTTDLKQASDFIIELPSRAATINHGQGIPVSYTLIPLHALTFMVGVDVRSDEVFNPDCINFFEELVGFVDEVRASARDLDDYRQGLRNYQHCIPTKFFLLLAQRAQALKGAEPGLSKFGILLRAHRSSLDNEHKLQMQRQLEEIRRMVPSSKEISHLTSQFREKIEFVNRLRDADIKYFGKDVESIRAAQQNSRIDDFYVLNFTQEMRLKSASWDKSYQLLLQLARGRTPGRVVAVLECEDAGMAGKKEQISHFRKGQLLVTDLLDKVTNGKSLVYYMKEGKLDQNDVKKPLRRSAVRLACPSRQCSRDLEHEWFCHKCQERIEYSSADQHFYCDCGSSSFTNYGFKCKELGHGDFFERYDKRNLRRLLDALEALDELNILIIGETGVGKSTFINAFLNYILYTTLDEAIKSKDLDSLIPCSFDVQTMDRSDAHGTIKRQRVKVGDDPNEADGSTGVSATQRPVVYPVTIGDTVVRLIDTPGIGDTRGIEKDKENMASILGMLSNFDKLHGIIFLLKSNSSRLTLMFRFVVEELLTHLHRDAALNMVFGFTNTRISNYMPGDTYGPLEELLKKHRQANISLSQQSVYCFDSESFRFLAAEKNGVFMENIRDYRLSWEKSEQETKRLIEHFRTLKPHLVRSTLSLNQTRTRILQLTRPMADILQEIDTTIKLNIDNIADLSDTKLKGAKLKERLHWEKTELEVVQYDHPRTVCNDVDCKEYQDDGSGHRQVIYKSICHPDCSVRNVTPETLSSPEIMQCRAFGGKEECRRCEHRWENHLHIMYEVERKMKTVKDEAVVELLEKNASDISLKEAAIKNLVERIEEAKSEHDQIQEAAVRFGFFLKKHSITPYNDAMLGYLDHLIKEEKDKVGVAGGRADRLTNLERHRREHQQQVHVLSQMMAGGVSQSTILDEAGIQKEVAKLFKLPHWGKNLQNVSEGAEQAHLNSYREKPYRAQNKTAGMNAEGVTFAKVDAIDWMIGKLGIMGRPRPTLHKRLPSIPSGSEMIRRR